MSLKCGAAIAVTTFALAGACRGQSTTTLYLVKTENLDQLSNAGTASVPNPDNAYWIGHAPTCIAYGKGRLFVGGINNGGLFPLDGSDANGNGDITETTPFKASIVKIDDILTVRTFRTVPGSRISPSVGMGFKGLDYAPNVGNVVRGLVATWDANGSGTNQLMRFSVDRVGSGLLAAPVPDLVTGFRLGTAGPAWDFGPTGNGVDYLPNGAVDGVPDGPVVAVIDLNSLGPYGTDPNTLNAGFGQTLYELGINNGPRLAADTEGQPLWRDLCFDRRNGNIAARSDNAVTFCTRNADGTTTRVDLAPSDPMTELLVPTSASPVTGQNVAIMSGYDPSGVGDLLAWNDRSSSGAGQAFATVVKFNKTNRVPATESGATVTPTYLNPDNTPASLPSGNGLYDFYWDATTRILFVLDSGNRNVYFLSAERPRSCCVPNGVCAILNSTACASTDVGGTAGALGSVCSPNPCAQPTIACCAAAGGCTNSTASVCIAGGGVPQALGSTCSPSPCPQVSGACCNGTVCAVTSAGGCLGAFKGAGTTCDFAGNPVTCCKANFNRIGGVTVQDIFDFLSAYFNGIPAADINGVGGVTVQDVFDFLAYYFAGCP